MSAEKPQVFNVICISKLPERKGCSDCGKPQYYLDVQGTIELVLVDEEVLGVKVEKTAIRFVPENKLPRLVGEVQELIRVASDFSGQARAFLIRNPNEPRYHQRWLLVTDSPVPGSRHTREDLQEMAREHIESAERMMTGGQIAQRRVATGRPPK